MCRYITYTPISDRHMSMNHIIDVARCSVNRRRITLNAVDFKYRANANDPRIYILISKMNLCYSVCRLRLVEICMYGFRRKSSKHMC